MAGGRRREMGGAWGASRPGTEVDGDLPAGRRAACRWCVQPLVGPGQEAEDYTRGKNDDRDAVLIARLAAPAAPLPARAGGSGSGRGCGTSGPAGSRLIEASTMCVQQLRDLLEVAWPAVLPAAADPLESATWLACLSAALGRGDGDLGAVHAAGQDAFIAAARGGLGAWGVRRICRRIAVAVYAALADGAGVQAQRPGALERAFSVLGDWRTIRGGSRRQRQDAAGPGGLGCWRWPGRSPGCVGAAGRGDLGDRRPVGSPPPARWSTQPAWRHVRTSGSHVARVAPSPPRAARAVWLPGAPSGARCHTRSTPPGTSLTGRAEDQLTDQRPTAIAAALSARSAIITRRTPWDAKHRRAAPPRPGGERRRVTSVGAPTVGAKLALTSGETRL
jgi:hypothetical protein